jgi:hypothetical protein
MFVVFVVPVVVSSDGFAIRTLRREAHIDQEPREVPA